MKIGSQLNATPFPFTSTTGTATFTTAKLCESPATPVWNFLNATSSDYVVTLPQITSGILAYYLYLICPVSNTKTVTVTASTTNPDFIDGAVNQVLVPGETATLIIGDIFGWYKVFGKVSRLSVKVQLTSTQSIANSTNVLVSWSSAAWKDMADMWASGSNVTVRRTGKYRVTLQTAWASNSTGQRTISAAGSTAGSIIVERKQAFGESESSIGAEVLLTAGETVSMTVFQSSGAALNLTSASMTITEIPQW